MSHPDIDKRIALAYAELSEALLAKLGYEDGVSTSLPQPVVNNVAPAPQTAQAQPVQTDFPGNCPVHNKPFTTVKANGEPAKRAFCKTKIGEGWCDEKGPWLQPKS
jgi:hypothetical protein